MTSPIRARVYIAPAIPWSKPDGSIGGPWSPIACTLVHTAHEAVLVNTAITKQQNKDLADWIAQAIPGKRLKAIYITQGHADFWLGIGYLKKRFPGVQAVATRGTIRYMQEPATPKVYQAEWGGRFPGQIDEDFVFVEPIADDGSIELEEHSLQVVNVGPSISPAHDATILWVPSLKLVVLGDVAYGDVPQMLASVTTKALREQWIRAIEKVQTLEPEIVVPAHQKPGELGGSYHLKLSKQYIRDFQAAVDSGPKDARELSKLMLEKYPARFNRGALYASTMAAIPKKRSNL